MQIHGSVFMRLGYKIDIHPSRQEGTPILTLDTLSVHLPNDGTLVDLRRHIDAYLTQERSELDPAAEACREMAKGGIVSKLPLEFR